MASRFLRVTWDRQRVGVAAGMGCALLLTLAGFSLPFLWPHFPDLPSSAAERAAVWAAASVAVVFWVVIAVGRLARYRFVSPADINAGASAEGTAQARMLQAMLQNTLEQAFLAVVAYGAWIALVDVQLGALPVLFAAYFSFGRILFFSGYARGASARAFGFALTFYPSVCLIVAAVPEAVSRLVPVFSEAV